MASQAQPLSILFFPFMAAGHMIPMVDTAKLFAARGVNCIILTTPGNAPLIQPSIDHCSSESARSRLKLHLVPFPSGFGLPEGCEHLSSVPRGLDYNFFNAVSSLRQLFGLVVKELQPDCVVSDAIFSWTYGDASELGIPRISFHVCSFFANCACDSVISSKAWEDAGLDANDSFVVPGLPHRIEMLNSQLSDYAPEIAIESLRKISETDMKSYGVLMNSFNELEPDYVRHYTEVLRRRAWSVGPVSLCDQGTAGAMVDRGNSSAMDYETCLSWLGSKIPGSVVYVSFGSLGKFSKDQLGEIADSLEASGHPFIWVLAKGQGEMIKEGYDKRIGGRGLIIRGWAPQTAILSHGAVGGFVTHCGWNSSIEGVSAGLPLVTWPLLYAEQFFNEKLIVEVLKIGVAVGSKTCTTDWEQRPVIKAGDIQKAIRRLMDKGEEGEGRRMRARDLREMAKRAVQKDGSSYQNMSDLIQDLMKGRQTRIKGHA